MIQSQDLNQLFQSMTVIWYTVLTGQFSRWFENKDNIFQVEVVSELDFEFCYFVNIVITQILAEPGPFGAVSLFIVF